MIKLNTLLHKLKHVHFPLNVLLKIHKVVALLFFPYSILQVILALKHPRIVLDLGFLKMEGIKAGLSYILLSPILSFPLSLMIYLSLKLFELLRWLITSIYLLNKKQNPTNPSSTTLQAGNNYVLLRALAGLVDYLVILAVLITFTYFWGTKIGPQSYTLVGMPFYMLILVWVLWTAGIESLCGATIGNYLMGLKVVSKDSPHKSPKFFQSLKRHLVDWIDLFPFGLIGIMLILNTSSNQRLGDILANTVVVKRETT